MKSALNNACISALLCGAVIFAAPAIAQQGAAGVSGSAGATATGAVNPAASAGISGSMNTPAGSVMTNSTTNTQAHGGPATTDTTASMSTQTPAARMSSRARASANASEVEATRQLNSQATLNARGTTGATIQ